MVSQICHQGFPPLKLKLGVIQIYTKSFHVAIILEVLVNRLESAVLSV